MVDAKKVATVTRNVLEITAANPSGAMRRMIRVMVPLTAAREKLRIVDARDVMYIVVLFCVEYGWSSLVVNGG
jgi:hypothetical protein